MYIYITYIYKYCVFEQYIKMLIILFNNLTIYLFIYNKVN